MLPRLTGMRGLSLLILVQGCACEGKFYGGWNISAPLCAGVVSFQLQNDTPINTLEGAVATIDSYVPVWASLGCRVAIRTVECINNYAEYADTHTNSFCMHECEGLLGQCDSLLSILEVGSTTDASSGAAWLESVCVGKPTSNCLSFGQATVISSDYPSCPKPAVVVPDEAAVKSATDENTSILYIPGTACALGCPNPEFTANEYKARKLVCLCLSAVAIIGSGLCIRKYLNPKTRKRAPMQLVILFAVSCLGLSLAAFIQVVFNWNDLLRCRGNSAFLRRPTTCVALTAAMHWFSICAETIAALQAFHIWSLATQMRNAADTFIKWYVGISILVPTVIIAVAVGAKQISTDGAFGLSIFCLFEYHNNTHGVYWFWMLFFGPLCLLILSCAIFFVLLLLHSFRVAKNVARSRQSFEPKTSVCPLLRKLATAHRRTLSLLLAYCALLLVVLGLFLNIYGTNDTKYSRHQAVWIDCLLEATARSGDYSSAYRTCGHVPPFRLQPWMIGFIEVYISALGIVPSIVFGIFTEPCKCLQPGCTTLTIAKQKASPKIHISEELKMPDPEPPTSVIERSPHL